MTDKITSVWLAERRPIYRQFVICTALQIRNFFSHILNTDDDEDEEDDDDDDDIGDDNDNDSESNRMKARAIMIQTTRYIWKLFHFTLV